MGFRRRGGKGNGPEENKDYANKHVLYYFGFKRKIWEEYYIKIIIHYILFTLINLSKEMWGREKQDLLFIIQWDEKANK